MCVLAAPHAALGFELEAAHSTGELRCLLRLDSRSRRVVVTREADFLDADAKFGIERILTAANELLAKAGDRRFELVRGPAPESSKSSPVTGTDNKFNYRVTFGDAEPLPTFEDVVDETGVFRADPGYPALLARHFEELAAFADAGPVRCGPTPSLAPMFVDETMVSLRVVWLGDVTVQETVRLPRISNGRLELQPLFDCINARLSESSYELYRCADRPWGEVAVRASKAEAAALRRSADLIEPLPARDILTVLGGAGFRLPYMSGHWSAMARFRLERCLAQVRELGRGRIELEVELTRDDIGGLTIAARCGDSVEVADYPAGLATDDVLATFAKVIGQLNRALESGRCDHRLLIVAGAPLWYEHRLFLLPTPWANQIAFFRETVNGCLTPRREPMAWPIRYPELPIDVDFPRLPEVREIVPEARVLDSDFKCSARPSDFFDVLREIAGFARLELDVDEEARQGPGPDECTLTVTCRDRGATIIVESRKYLNVAPIVEAFNRFIEESDSELRLYQYDGGHFDGGVLLANAAEVTELRRCGYVTPLA